MIQLRQAEQQTRQSCGLETNSQDGGNAKVKQMVRVSDKEMSQRILQLVKTSDEHC